MRNRTNIIAVDRNTSDTFAVIAATSPNVPAVTTLQNDVTPELIPILENIERGRKHVVRILNGRGDISADATAHVNIIVQAPLNVDGTVVLAGMAPGDATFYTKEDNPELDNELRELLQDPRTGWQYVMRTSSTGLISLAPFSYTPNPEATTVMVFRDEIDGRPNLVLQSLMKMAHAMRQRNARNAAHRQRQLQEAQPNAA
jgi:hypothetical protein